MLMKLTSSERLANALAKMNIHDEKDLLLTFPYRYEDLTPTKDKLYHDQQRLVLIGKVTSTPTVFYKGSLVMTRFTFKDHHQHLIHVVAFRRPYLAKMLLPGEVFTVVGKYQAAGQVLNLINIMKGELDEASRFKPVYRLPSDIEPHHFQRMMKKAILHLSDLTFTNHLPSSLIQSYGLQAKAEALKTIHQPSSIEAASEAMKVFKFEEAMTMMQKMLAIREENQASIKEKMKLIPVGKVVDCIESLPYPLTTDQLEAVNDLLSDMNDRKRMYRLLQGDVGSGKTVVAALALYGNALRHAQGAFMAPTDALAKQHFLTLQNLLGSKGLTIRLLTGSMSHTEKKAIKESLHLGAIDIIVGTHTLFSTDTSFFSLGLAVIDEQHRFGVNQRDLLKDKGKQTDILMMSATPIPRSLAMTVYADMDITTLTKFPFAAKKVKTALVEEDDALIAYAIASALEQQKRIYIVAPKIMESSRGKQSVISLFQRYAKHYPKQVGLLHGKLDQEDKDAILHAFITGYTPILVSTTVIEVGIDVKPATVMIIHDADSFGLASLHQLRGRIGRDGSEAICLLVVQDKNVEGLERLQVMVQSNDGFFIAEQDLALRGPGEMTGMKQAGIPGFQYLNIVLDQPIIKAVKAYLTQNP